MTTDTDLGLLVGVAAEDWAEDAEYFEYSRAANPVGSGHTPKLPIELFPSTLYEGGESRVVPLDLSSVLGGTRGPATSPALLASFVKILAGDEIGTESVATSDLFFVLSGSGSSVTSAGRLEWGPGDLFVVPSGGAMVHTATDDTVLYWVNDAPLLRYLGVVPSEARFRGTRFSGARLADELAAIAADPHAEDRNRLSVLMATAPQTQTLTVTHVLWAMYGLLPAGAVQRPHRHQSVALDLVVDCPPGCYTLLGRSLDERGDIERPIRVDWEPGAAFVTPPGLWHAHVNESGTDAHILPIQDAGLHTYLRSLDIRFAPPAP
ncbi:cupin [Aquihabitans sp. McL0605]|uniref:cupin n=1 Tax=Aquihabitans sp. McL0605 TaxID=3415671 RepID=UPI003CF56F28